MPDKSEIKGLGALMDALDTTITAKMMAKAADILKKELVAEAKKSLARRVGVIGREIGKDQAAKEASDFVRSIRVKVQGEELVVTWDAEGGTTEMRGGVEGASWVHPSIKKGGYLQQALESAQEKISAMLAEEITQRWADNL